MAREIDEIKDAAGAYRKWALEARKKYIELRLRQDPEIRGLYVRSADRVAKEIRKLALKTPSSYLRKRQLGELERALRMEAERLAGDLTKALEAYIEEAVNAGAGYSQAVTLDLFKKAGIDTAGLRTMFATVNRQAVEACWARTKKGLFLSDRIWQQGENFRNTMRDIVQETVAVGQDAVKTARVLQQYVRQGAQTLAREYPNMMERMGNRVPKDICYEALRLARTEMTAAFGEGTIAAAQVSPSYIGMKWVLSHSHPMVDICDTLAEHDEGLGRGVYSAGNEPHLPAHPNCICSLVPVHEEPEKFVERLKKWRGDPTSDQELEKWYNRNARRFLKRPSTVSGIGTKAENLPEIIDDATFEREVKAGATVVYRGISGDKAKQYADELRQGIQYIPNDAFGRGTFVAVGKGALETAVFFAKDDGVVMKMILKNNAKIILREEAIKTINSELEKIKQEYFEKVMELAAKQQIDEINSLTRTYNDTLQKYEEYLKDPTVWAKEKGYDGVRQRAGATPSDEIVLLNLSKLKVVDKDWTAKQAREILRQIKKG